MPNNLKIRVKVHFKQAYFGTFTSWWGQSHAWGSYCLVAATDQIQTGLSSLDSAYSSSCSLSSTVLECDPSWFLLCRSNVCLPTWRQRHMTNCWGRWRCWRWRTQTCDRSCRTTPTTWPNWRLRPPTWRSVLEGCCPSLSYLWTTRIQRIHTVTEWNTAHSTT